MFRSDSLVGQADVTDKQVIQTFFHHSGFKSFFFHLLTCSPVPMLTCSRPQGALHPPPPRVTLE